MGLFSNLLSSAVKVVLTPVAAATDAVKVVVGEEPDTTKKLVKGAVKDLGDAVDDLSDGNL